jgi:hypothetical protein
VVPGNTENRGDGVRTTHEHRGTSCLAVDSNAPVGLAQPFFPGRGGLLTLIQPEMLAHVML